MVIKLVMINKNRLLPTRYAFNYQSIKHKQLTINYLQKFKNMQFLIL